MIPAITVVIPTFNRLDPLKFALNSVLAQTYAATEIIVVDDGSKIDVATALIGWDSHIRVIRQANAGLSEARNTGIKAAKTEWVAFLDDDDKYEPDHLMKVANNILRYPSIDVHICNALIVSNDASVNLFALRGMPQDSAMVIEDPLAWVLKGCCFSQSLVIRRSILINAGLFKTTLYEDMELYVRLSQRATWVIDGHIGFRLMRVEGNTMSDEWRSKPARRCQALINIHKNALAVARTPHERRLALKGLATYLYELGETTGERNHFFEAARMFPAVHSKVKSLIAGVGGPLARESIRALRRRQTLVR